MAPRIRFSLAALLRCAFFAALGFSLLGAALRSNGDEADQLIRVWLALASAGASIGSLLGDTTSGALIGITILPACYCAFIAIFAGFVLFTPLVFVETGWLKWSILACPLSVLPACALATRRAKWGGAWLAASGMISAGSILLAWKMPWLVRSPPKSLYDHDGFNVATSFVFTLLLSLAMAAFGAVLVRARPKSKPTL